MRLFYCSLGVIIGVIFYPYALELLENFENSVSKSPVGVNSTDPINQTRPEHETDKSNSTTDNNTNWNENEEINILREYLRIPSAHPDIDYGIIFEEFNYFIE